MFLTSTASNTDVGSILNKELWTSQHLRQTIRNQEIAETSVGLTVIFNFAHSTISVEKICPIVQFSFCHVVRLQLNEALADPDALK